MKSKIIEEDVASLIVNNESSLKTLAGKNILITGGNGFLPSYLVDTLATFNQELQDKYKLVILNKHPVTPTSRLSHLLADPQIRFIEQDIGKPFKVPKGLDIIVHAASRANPASFLADPLDTIDANVNGTRTLLEYARDNPLDQFLFFSSAEIYGNPLSEFVPTPETYPGNVDCTVKTACYTESKRFSETLCQTFFEQFKTPSKILRILLGYGPGMRDDGRVVVDFFKKGREEGKITIRDRGESCRSFCYISDITQGILDVMFKGEDGEAYNVANDLTNIPIKGLARLIANTLNKDMPVETSPSAKKKEIYGVDARDLDISKLRALGFIPRISLEEGLLRMKAHYDQLGQYN
jgi:UDP-glucuronate decarboxylase